MPSYKVVTNKVDIMYLYDGSYAGLLTSIHESVYAKEMPVSILSKEPEQLTLYGTKSIKTDEKKALAVKESIEKNISKQVATLTYHIFLCHHVDKEIKLLRFLIKAYEVGAKIVDMTGDAVVADVLAMQQHMLGERHLLSGFIRFKDYGNILGAVISPKNFVLPLLANHFIDRFPSENFMIYDNVHKAILVYQDKKLEITAVEEIEFAQESETELYYQELWKSFYDTIGIKERLNPKCRMRNMPKRYWANMVEMEGKK